MLFDAQEGEKRRMFLASDVIKRNGVFGKLPSHQMAVAIMCLIGKEIREIHFGHRALPYILCAYKYIQCL